MSHESNTLYYERLHERAVKMLDAWTGTQHAKNIDFALELNDMELLETYVEMAEKAHYKDWERSVEHFYNHDLMPKVDPQELDDVPF